MRRLHRGHWALVLAIGLVLPRAASAGPEIFSITPESGQAGIPIQIKGKGLAKTGRVVFGIGHLNRQARFKVISDQEIEVLAPECYRAGAAATIAVFTETGAAVAMPATVQTIRSSVQGTNVAESGESFCHVLGGGILTTATSVAVIEKDGVVLHSSSPAMHFVKRGGTLLEFRNPSGIVFYERGAQLGPGVVIANRPAPVTLVRVPEITACPGIGPFRYRAPLIPDLSKAPETPPLIRGFSPRAAGAGEMITLTGKGFARTKSVRFLGQTGGSTDSGFRLVSDHELRVEVPEADALRGPQLLAVVTTEGVAVTVPRNATIRPTALALSRRNRGLVRASMLWIGSGEMVVSVPSQSIFIAPGGMVTQADQNHHYFIQHAGRLGDGGGNPSTVFFEPDAILPDRLKRAPIGELAQVIVPSPVDDSFVILGGTYVRR
jgi:hypothetical protein